MMEPHTKIGKYPYTDAEVAELREYFGEQIAKEIEAELCQSNSGCYGVNQEHCDYIKECIGIAKGHK
jgi:hypothetical protein